MSAIEYFTNAVRDLRPTLAIVLGSGQSSVLRELDVAAVIAFADVPGLAAPSVAGHSGQIVAGTSHGKSLLVFQGRLHFYEGHSSDVVAAPIRFATGVGVKTLLLTNAAGGIHPSLHPGSLMIVRDHLFWQRPGSWRGPGPAGCDCLAGDRQSTYSQRLIRNLQEAGHAIGEELPSGLYVALTGPCYETPAEIRALRTCGADAVGMSTAHEVVTGSALGLECAAISCITNQAAGLGDGPLDHKDVLDAAARTRDRLGQLIAEFVKRTG
jgi:purine-nucleoside phosphorylase